MGQLLADADGADTGAAATVRHSKGLVEVEVAHIGTHMTGAGETHLGVHVGTVHVDEGTLLVMVMEEWQDCGKMSY